MTLIEQLISLWRIRPPPLSSEGQAWELGAKRAASMRRMTTTIAADDADNERQMLQLIDERDAAEEAVSQAYYLVTGRSPGWSSEFGHQQALEEIADAVALLKASIPRR